jgi:hypothetical protein
VIHGVLPRRTKLFRKFSGRETAEQILVTKIDIAFVVLALAETFNARLRAFHLWMAVEGIHEAFPDIETLPLQCRFRECSHTQEKDCAVKLALVKGTLSQERFNNFAKLRQELAFLGQTRLYHQPFGCGASETDKRKKSARKKWRYTGDDPGGQD